MYRVHSCTRAMSPELLLKLPGFKDALTIFDANEPMPIRKEPTMSCSMWLFLSEPELIQLSDLLSAFCLSQEACLERVGNFSPWHASSRTFEMGWHIQPTGTRPYLLDPDGYACVFQRWNGRRKKSVSSEQSERQTWSPILASHRQLKSTF